MSVKRDGFCFWWRRVQPFQDRLLKAEAKKAEAEAAKAEKELEPSLAPAGNTVALAATPTQVNHPHAA